ncbi:hypothetical protein AB0O91_36170 [Kitasatospora sp. NPDC089797]|uniref:hypothetical protein n=1 Tax=Kitasatospora sp. NPDC089797 TaxID=3155298 RepID=UPI00342B1E72
MTPHRNDDRSDDRSGDRNDRQGRPEAARLTTHLLRRALALYPASYSADALADVADHAERRVRTAGPIAGLREVADVAGHGLRVRYGLTSHRPAGRALATAAPIAAALVGSYAAVHLWWAVRAAGDPGAWAVIALLVPAALMAVAALTGRWTTARVLAAVTVVLAPLPALLGHPELPGAYTHIPLTYTLGGPDAALFALNALVLVLAPPDRTTQPRNAVPWAVVIALTAVDLALALSKGSDGATVVFSSGFHLTAPLVTGVAVACTTRTVRSAALTAAVLAVPPLFTPTLVGYGFLNATATLALAVPFAAGYAAALTAVRLKDRLNPRPDPQH